MEPTDKLRIGRVDGLSESSKARTSEANEPPVDGVEPKASPTPETPTPPVAPEDETTPQGSPSDYEELKAFRDRNQALFDYVRQPGVIDAIERMVSMGLGANAPVEPSPQRTASQQQEPAATASLIDLSSLGEDVDPAVKAIAEGVNALAKRSGTIEQFFVRMQQIEAQRAEEARAVQRSVDVAVQMGLTHEQAVQFVQKARQDPTFVDKALINAFKAEIGASEPPKVPEERLTALNKNGSESDASRLSSPTTPGERKASGFDETTDKLRIGRLGSSRLQAALSKLRGN